MRIYPTLVLMIAFLTCNIVIASPVQDETLERENYQKNFLERYEFFITKQEKKDFESLQTDEEKDGFIVNFWQIRDPDPNTLNNEFKEGIDQRIKDIENEILQVDFDAAVRFKFNKGLKGDLARVYLLYGMPPIKKKLTGMTFSVDLMLWVYLDDRSEVKYLFLFYKERGYKFKLFRGHFGNLPMALSTISSRFVITTTYWTDEIEEIYYEIERQPEGRSFLWALSEFAPRSNISVGKALEPPTPALIVAQEAGHEMLGQSVATDEAEIRHSPYFSELPASIVINKENYSVGFVIKIKNLDWVEKENELKCLLKVQINLQSYEGNITKVLEKEIPLSVKKEANPDNQVVINVLLVKPGEKLDAGTYLVNIFLQNTLTNKYNAWQLKRFSFDN